MKMTVTRALAELKTLDARISKQIGSSVFAGVVIGAEEKPHRSPFKSVDEMKSEIKGAFDSVSDLIKRRTAIKSAVIHSNAITMVVIGEAEMSVASAIDLKTTINFNKQFVNSVKRQIADAVYSIDSLNSEMENRIERTVANSFGSDRKGVDDTIIKSITNQIKNGYEPKLVSIQDVNAWVKKYEEKISVFETNVDFALSEINAKTEIEIDV